MRLYGRPRAFSFLVRLSAPCGVGFCGFNFGKALPSTFRPGRNSPTAFVRNCGQFRTFRMGVVVIFQSFHKSYTNWKCPLLSSGIIVRISVERTSHPQERKLDTRKLCVPVSVARGGTVLICVFRHLSIGAGHLKSNVDWGSRCFRRTADFCAHLQIPKLLIPDVA